MKTKGFTLFFFLFSITVLHAQRPDIEWERIFGGTQSEEIYDLKQTPDGGYLLAGISYSGVSGNKTVPAKGGGDFWLIRLNASGDTLWQKAIGGSGYDALWTMEPTSDGGFLLGGSSGSNASGDKTEDGFGGTDYWLVKIDSNGNVLWDKTLGGSDTEHLFSAKEDANGGYILAGSSRSPISGNKTATWYGNYDYWVVKLDDNRNIAWQASFGGDLDDDLQDIEQTPDGGFILGGYSRSDSTGNKTEASYGYDDFWAIKINKNGILEWEKAYGGIYEEFMYNIEITDDNGFAMSGFSGSEASGNKADSTNGGGDYWIVKTDSLGAIEWDRSIGGAGLDEAISTQKTADGGFILAGYTDSDVSGDKTEPAIEGLDIWVVKLDSDGNLEWDKTINNSFDEYIWGLEQTADKGYILGCGSGYFMAPGNGVDAFGEFDYWVVKLEGCSPSESVAVINACGQYTAPNGLTFSTSGDYSYTLTNLAGCDSIVNLSLTISNSYIHSYYAMTCGSFYAPDGSLVTQDTIIEETLLSVNGCDSIVIWEIDIAESNETIIAHSECNSYVAPNGQTYTESGIYTENLYNQYGCDSTIVLDLTIFESDTSMIFASACDIYYSPDGTSYTSSGIYDHIYFNENGCDSLVSLDLTITTIDPNVTQNGDTLTSIETNANYQWLDCNNDSSPVVGATSQFFIPEIGGDYAVVITKNDCTKISGCFNFSTVGINENDFGNALKHYPSPTTGEVNFVFNMIQQNITYKVFNPLGEMVLTGAQQNAQNFNLNLTGVSGLYIIQIQTDDGKQASLKIIKQE